MTVRYEIDGAVATVTIARPEVRNAIDMEVFAALGEAGRRAGADPGVRAVLVTGEGGFSSGIDTSVFSSGGGDPRAIDIAKLQDSFTVFERIPKPVVAAVGGWALGAGFQLALACDLIVAAEDARFSLMEVQWGILPDLGGIHRLARIAGTAVTRDLALTARRIDGREAAAAGIVARVVPATELDAAARALAEELAAGPPLALAAIKRLVNMAFDVPVRDGLEREAAMQRRVLMSRDFLEAVSARMQRRPPAFEAR